MNTTVTTDALPEALRADMVDRIIKAGHARSVPVEAALRAVPRHRYVPSSALEDAYADSAVITKRAGDGRALSCASEPTIVAMMLDQLDVRPGVRILEIGAGTGYNAALLAHLTGPSGEVTTIDIDAEVTAQARHSLDATGYHQVHVLTRNGTVGAQENAPYDRVIFTVGAWDLPPAYWDQLAPDGRLVVPLRWRGQTRSVAFVRERDRLRSDSMELCGFVPMLGQDGERTGPIDADRQVALHWDADQAVDLVALRGLLTTDKTEVWSEVMVGGYDSFDGIWLRLTATEPGTCRIAADRSAVDAKLCTPAVPSRSPALVERGSLAYLALRRRDEVSAEAGWELGAIGHGPARGELATRICKQIHAWNRDRTAQPVAILYRADVPDHDLLGVYEILKRDTRLMVSF